ncbi:hypothetical protein P910_003350 [Xylella fastidiosa Mul-MD]|nr:hypothetical protein P303_05175 [Xylella fastidiosa MUL0034]AIC14003.1 hypothetical protein P303_09480 [Xylella fastidiosa MUL0034]EWG13402.1 hypothetical protein P910_003350 [Xylella fastidiosa Mul-MD]
MIVLQPLKVLGALACLLCLLLLLRVPYGMGYRAGASEWKAKFAEADSQYQTLRNQITTAERAMKVKTDAASQQLKVNRENVDEALKQAKADAVQLRSELAAALRAGHVRLRQEWSGCVQPAPSGSAAAHATDADARRRTDGAGRLVAATATDAAVITGLWAAWKADRDAVIAAGCAVEAHR